MVPILGLIGISVFYFGVYEFARQGVGVLIVRAPGF